VEPFETFEHAGMTCELYQDEEPSSPAEWDNIGILVAGPSLARAMLGEHRTTSAEDDAIGRGGAALLVRYLRMVEGEIAVPFHFADYGSGGARIWATGLDDDAPSGFIVTTHQRVNELFGTEPQYHTQEWIENALRAELRNWDAYVEGRVVGVVVRDPSGAVVDSVWGIYPDDEGDGLEYARTEVRGMAEYAAQARAEARHALIASGARLR